MHLPYIILEAPAGTDRRDCTTGCAASGRARATAGSSSTRKCLAQSQPLVFGTVLVQRACPLRPRGLQPAREPALGSIDWT